MLQTILLVDDDEDLILQQKIFLENKGYAVISAFGHEEALELLNTVKPDLAIIDLMMEEKDSGFMLAYQLKKHNPLMPVIIATSVSHETGIDFNTMNDSQKKWIKADVILSKPVRFEQLKAEIERLLP